ncbi:MAG: PIG-L family deacetylase [Candidatus Thorarchaeota archaeon]|nr:PIG-L family deacetylase [Candidatus Thorarchaeota archaeon]
MIKRDRYLLLMPASDDSILVVCAHPDDESIGGGGTIAAHAAQGHSVDVLCLTGTEVRNRELREACRVLGVRDLYACLRADFEIDLSLVDDVAQTILKSRPRIILTHSPSDYNRGHVMCSQIVNEAVEWASHTTMFENAHRVEQVYHMEINSLLNRPTVMVDITLHYETALQALQCYSSQIQKADGFYPRLYDSRTRLRGVQAGCQRAEAFSLHVPIHAGPFYPSNNVRSLF